MRLDVVDNRRRLDATNRLTAEAQRMLCPVLPRRTIPLRRVATITGAAAPLIGLDALGALVTLMTGTKQWRTLRHDLKAAWCTPPGPSLAPPNDPERGGTVPFGRGRVLPYVL